MQLYEFFSDLSSIGMMFTIYGQNMLLLEITKMKLCWLFLILTNYMWTQQDV